MPFFPAVQTCNDSGFFSWACTASEHWLQQAHRSQVVEEAFIAAGVRLLPAPGAPPSTAAVGTSAARARMSGGDGVVASNGQERGEMRREDLQHGRTARASEQAGAMHAQPVVKGWHILSGDADATGTVDRGEVVEAAGGAAGKTEARKTEGGGFWPGRALRRLLAHCVQPRAGNSFQQRRERAEKTLQQQHAEESVHQARGRAADQTWPNDKVGSNADSNACSDASGVTQGRWNEQQYSDSSSRQDLDQNGTCRSTLPGWTASGRNDAGGSVPSGSSDGTGASWQPQKMVRGPGGQWRPVVATGGGAGRPRPRGRPSSRAPEARARRWPPPSTCRRRPCRTPRRRRPAPWPASPAARCSRRSPPRPE